MIDMKVILWMAMSVNGIIATNDGGEDFLSHENWENFVKDVKKVGCLIWGRKTYEAVKKWESSYLEPFEKIVKVIVTSDSNYKLDEGYILASSSEEALEILKKRGFDTVILTGGSKNNCSFAKLGLIDEVVVNLEPVILGQGIPLFAPEDFEMKLKLISEEKMGNGILQLKYNVLK